MLIYFCQISRCEKDCKTGRYGLNCKQKCNCQNDAPCDSKDGTCHCPVGFIGKFCDSICPPGRYGRNCSGVCNCISNQTDLCNYQDGTCECMPGMYYCLSGPWLIRRVKILGRVDVIDTYLVSVVVIFSILLALSMTVKLWVILLGLIWESLGN